MHHQALLHRGPQGLFPTIPSNPAFWESLSRKPLFDGISPRNLADQMVALLDLLLWLTLRTDNPHDIKLSPDFTSLQNVGIYMEAFAIEQDPRVAFTPLDTGKLTRSLYPDHRPKDLVRTFEIWDAHFQHCLPIKRPQTSVSK